MWKSIGYKIKRSSAIGLFITKLFVFGVAKNFFPYYFFSSFIEKLFSAKIQAIMKIPWRRYARLFEIETNWNHKSVEFICAQLFSRIVFIHFAGYFFLRFIIIINFTIFKIEIVKSFIVSNHNVNLSLSTFIFNVKKWVHWMQRDFLAIAIVIRHFFSQNFLVLIYFLWKSVLLNLWSFI